MTTAAASSVAEVPSLARTTVRVVVAFASLVVFVGSLTVLFLAGRAVMDIGGSCASGGPYVVARTCPKGTGWMAPVSIFVGLGAIIVHGLVSMRLPGPRLALLAWPALFLSLGWSFWEYGLDPPGGVSGDSVGWIVCGVVFVLMGGAPLLLVVTSAAGRRNLLWGDALAEEPTSRTEAVRSSARELVPPVYRPRERRRRAARATTAAVDRVDDSTNGSDGDGIVDELERLARLHRRGDLTADEYAAAKARVLEGSS
jgi:Short C-terminal domain